MKEKWSGLVWLLKKSHCVIDELIQSLFVPL